MIISEEDQGIIERAADSQGVENIRDGAIARTLLAADRCMAEADRRIAELSAELATLKVDLGAGEPEAPKTEAKKPRGGKGASDPEAAKPASGA